MKALATLFVFLNIAATAHADTEITVVKADGTIVTGQLTVSKLEQVGREFVIENPRIELGAFAKSVRIEAHDQSGDALCQSLTGAAYSSINQVDVANDSLLPFQNAKFVASLSLENGRLVAKLKSVPQGQWQYVQGSLNCSPEKSTD